MTMKKMLVLARTRREDRAPVGVAGAVRDQFVAEGAQPEQYQGDHDPRGERDQDVDAVAAHPVGRFGDEQGALLLEIERVGGWSSGRLGSRVLLRGPAFEEVDQPALGAGQIFGCAGTLQRRQADSAFSFTASIKAGWT